MTDEKTLKMYEPPMLTATEANALMVMLDSEINCCFKFHRLDLDLANKVIGGCEYLGQFMQEMEPHRDWLGTHSNAEYADMLREAWDDYWSDKQ
jgi:hypothetical protein